MKGAFTVEVTVRIQAIALPEVDGGYSVLIPALGIAIEGDTIDEVRANVVEAAESWLASMHDRHCDEAIRVARGESEQLTPRRASLQKLVEKYPAPPEWYDEPEWNRPESLP
jgi:predicted RNase H-like HicB family nuclease